ncbi:MAG: glycosyltransferase family 39 protein [Myxococcales bacterium]
MTISSGLPRRRETLLLLGCVALFLALAGVRAWDHADPYYDDVAYLARGNEAREAGGPVGVFKGLLAGTWRDDNRHPLYEMVLSTVAGRDRGYHARARMVTVGLGLLALLGWWRVVRKRLGPEPALVVAAFLAVSECFIDYSGRESCEPLLLLFTGLALGAMVDGVTKPHRWLAAGAWSALAYLDKGTGFFLVPCFAIALLFWRGPRALRDPWAWGMGLAFVAVSSPLLWRNVRVYGSPLHQYNSELLWMDRMDDFAEIFAPGVLDQPRSFSTWAARTSWHEIWFDRFAMGTGETVIHIGDSLSFLAPTPLGAVHIPGLVLGFVLFLVALRLLYKAPPSFGRTLLLVQAGFFTLFFITFTSAGGSSRYVFPMTLPLYAVLAVALARNPVWLRRWLATAAICVVLALALDPAPRTVPPAYLEASAWFASHLRPGDAYAIDSRSRFQPVWFLPPSNRMVTVSSSWRSEPLQSGDLLSWFRGKGVRYVVIDYASRARESPRYFFFDRLPGPVPPGLHEVWAFPGKLQILELEPEGPSGSASRQD